MLERKLITTRDGSATILIPEWNESYHSVNGAVLEAIHVFICNGLNKINKKQLSILEIGFGTGLNSFLTMLNGIEDDLNLDYTGLEKYPVSQNEFEKLNYPAAVKRILKDVVWDETELNDDYLRIMESGWGEFHSVHPNFNLRKIKTDFFEFDYSEAEFDLVYFDAFGARVQPELWTVELFEKIHFSMKTGGLLTTYSSKGSVRRALKELGFEVEKLAGPAGKREMMNAVKK